MKAEPLLCSVATAADPVLQVYLLGAVDFEAAVGEVHDPVFGNAELGVFFVLVFAVGRFVVGGEDLAGHPGDRAQRDRRDEAEKDPGSDAHPLRVRNHPDGERVGAGDGAQSARDAAAEEAGRAAERSVLADRAGVIRSADRAKRSRD